jgi:hypothetical protein
MASRCRDCTIWLRIWLCAGLIATGASAADLVSTEYSVKAAFLLNFTKFIAWPTLPASEEGPFQICVLGDDPFGGALNRIAEGEFVNGRRLEVVRIRREEHAHCRVVFVGPSESDVARALASFGPGVLTVGESEKFLHDGGMIAFVIENRRVRFDVNLGAASRARLQISSRLLSVARSVEK